MPSQGLHDKMRALAAAGHKDADALLAHADLFEVAVEAFYSDPPTITVQKYLGVWAKARKVWCRASGEPLI